jgi:hypothetical protein
MPYMRAVWFGIAVLAGCATAGKDDGFTGGHVDAPLGGGQHDAPDQQQTDGSVTQHDAPMQSIDAPSGPQTATLTQTSDNTVTVGDSLACPDTAGNATQLDAWYRVFSLSAAGISGAFTVQQVDFAAQEAAGTQSVQVFVGTYTGTLGAGTLDQTKLTSLGNKVVSVPGTSTGEPLTASFTGITIPAGSNMYVEILSPDHSNTSTYFYVGASGGSQTTPAYIMAPGCGVTTPELTTTASAASGSVILTVTGTY